MKTTRIVYLSISIAIAFVLLVALQTAPANGQLSNIAWKAAEQIKADRDNKVTYNDEGFVSEVFIEDMPAQFMMGQLAVFPQLESVTIASRYSFDDANMGGVRKLKKLKKFALRNSRYATAATVELLAEAPSLESLELYENSNIESLHEVSRLQRLKELSIVPDESMSLAPLVECKKLESIKLTGSTSIDDGSVGELSRIESLRKIDLSNTSITDEGLSQLGKLPNLETLVLKNCEMITGEAFSEFQFPLSLKDLNLEGATKLNDDGLSQLSRFSQLEHLQLYRNLAVQGSGFECLATMKNLMTLKCPKTSIADRHLLLLDGIKSLKKIWLPECKAVSGKGLQSLSQSKNCEVLSLNRCRKIDSPDFEVLAKFTGLKELYIAETRIRNDGIERLCDLKKLETLNIGGNLWLEDAAIEKLENAALKQLIATDLPRLTDAALVSASKMKNLNQLSFTANAKLQGYGMKSFQGGERLRSLAVEAANLLPADAFRSIQKLTSIEELYFNKGKISVSQLEQLSGMQNLKKLRYEIEDPNGTSERLIGVLKTFPKLK